MEDTPSAESHAAGFCDIDMAETDQLRIAWHKKKFSEAECRKSWTVANERIVREMSSDLLRSYVSRPEKYRNVEKYLEEHEEKLQENDASKESIDSERAALVMPILPAFNRTGGSRRSRGSGKKKRRKKKAVNTFAPLRDEELIYLRQELLHKDPQSMNPKDKVCRLLAW